MLHTAAHYSPRQMLESAHRAEADGNLELAGQLYWHVSETYPHSAEGAEAYAGLGRIGPMPAAYSQPQMQPKPARAGNGMVAGPGPAGPYAGPAYAMPPTAARPHPQAQHQSARPRKLPPARHHYGFGHGVASVVGAFGWLLVLLAVLVPGAAAAGLLTMGVGPALLAAGAFAFAGVGLVAVLAAQAARAAFDQADAARELVSIERAKWGAEH